MLEILTPATTTDLIQLATVKAHLRPAPVGTTEDARLADLIRWASAAINRYCRRTFARQKYRETLAGSGSQLLMLTRTPVEADATTRLVTSASITGAAVTDYRVEDAFAGILWRESGWPTSYGARGLYGRRADRSIQDLEQIQVLYWAGYLMPGATPVSGAYDLPDDVERAALLTVQEWRTEAARDPSIASTSTTETEGDQSRTVAVSYTPARNLGDVGPLSAEVREMLRAYRR